MKQFAERENITEELKDTNQMEWVSKNEQYKKLCRRDYIKRINLYLRKEV